MRRHLGTWFAVLLLLVSASCGESRGSDSTADGRSRHAGGEVTVLAAASLTEAFDEMGRRYESTHPGARVSFSFAASSTLVHQLEAGAPADVVATADERTMDQALRAGTVDAPRVFASNRLAMVVARGNPKRIRSLEDLAAPGVTLVLCAPEVPCGALAAGVLRRAGVAARPRSLEANVKAVLSKVALGEADAGIVYATDIAAAAGRVEGVPVPHEHNLLTHYRIAVARETGNRPSAEAFVAFVLSDEGRRVLVDLGFEP